MAIHLFDYEPDDIDVRIVDLITATHDGGDPLVHPKVREALQVLRERLDMDVVFVSQFQNNRRTFRVVDSGARITKVIAGQSDPLEESWCQHVVDGRLPQYVRDARPFIEAGTVPDPKMPIGTHLSTPIVLKNGQVYGTLCCFSQDVIEGVSEMDLRRLRITAQVLSEDLHGQGIGGELQLKPRDSQR